MLDYQLGDYFEYIDGFFNTFIYKPEQSPIDKETLMIKLSQMQKNKGKITERNEGFLHADYSPKEKESWIVEEFSDVGYPLALPQLHLVMASAPILKQFIREQGVLDEWRKRPINAIFAGEVDDVYAPHFPFRL